MTSTFTAWQEASSIHDGLRRRMKDLQEYSIPNLRDCKGPLSLQQQLAADVRDDIEIFTRELQRLETTAGDQETEKDRLRVNDWLEEMNEMIQQIRKDARGALLASKRTIDSQSRSYKDELLRSNVTNTNPSSKEGEKLQGEDALMKAHNDVTDAFRRTTTLMQQELERSVLTSQMFDESSKTLQSTSDLYTAFGTLLNTSKALVTAMERSDWLDRLFIFSSLALFLMVAAYIVKKRLIDKGVWLAFWWVKYIPFPSSKDGRTDKALDLAEKGVKTMSQVTRSVVTAAGSASATMTASIATAIASTVDNEGVLPPPDVTTTLPHSSRDRTRDEL
ncbi:hypothetical protein FRB94_008779 [Tulasnella sp. JGI-2019a]|nr:hypothetical protein FRB93_008659 [Tulasnella sp. JGI-2019a]KAG8995752.1 hypothetical protein FRB94_008779 [Tulasnella sp. JGI-2019a]KAG9029916.1 hypothetical protein FRB95_004746 [Tulasnella sp. JGI-2019a]